MPDPPFLFIAFFFPPWLNVDELQPSLLTFQSPPAEGIENSFPRPGSASRGEEAPRL